MRTSKSILSADSITKSVMSLTRTNNGFFKSEIQANLLMDELRICKGYLGHTIGIKNSNPVFAEYDNKGIIKVYKNMLSSNKIEIIFERKLEGKLTSIEVKVLSSFKRKLKKLEKELEIRLIFFLPGRDTNEKMGVIEYIKSEIARLEK